MRYDTHKVFLPRLLLLYCKVLMKLIKFLQLIMYSVLNNKWLLSAVNYTFYYEKQMLNCYQEFDSMVNISLFSEECQIFLKIFA